jgi:hypothetical protein
LIIPRQVNLFGAFASRVFRNEISDLIKEL